MSLQNETHSDSKIPFSVGVDCEKLTVALSAEKYKKLSNYYSILKVITTYQAHVCIVIIETMYYT